MLSGRLGRLVTSGGQLFASKDLPFLHSKGRLATLLVQGEWPGWHDCVVVASSSSSKAFVPKEVLGMRR